MAAFVALPLAHRLLYDQPCCRASPLHHRRTALLVRLASAVGIVDQADPQQIQYRIEVGRFASWPPASNRTSSS
jgi:hypothetical protein